MIIVSPKKRALNMPHLQGEKYGSLGLGLVNGVLQCWVTLAVPLRKEAVSIS